MLDSPWPLYITVPWLTVIFSILCSYLYLRFKKDRTTIYGHFPDHNDQKEIKSPAIDEKILEQKKIETKNSDKKNQKSIKNNKKKN